MITPATASFKDFTSGNGSASASPQSHQSSSSASTSQPTALQMMMIPPDSDDNNVASDMLINYNEKFKDTTPASFRDDVIAQMTMILNSMTKPNVLLTGASGVGKTKVVEECARRIANGDDSIPENLADTTIFELPLASLVAGTGMVGALEEKMESVIEFAENEDVILFIDEIHMLASKNPSHNEISQMLKPALARGDMKIIGATTSQEARSLAADPAFQRRFSTTIVPELTAHQTKQTLKNAWDDFARHYNNLLTATDDVLSYVVATADHHGGHRPDNALTLLDRSASKVAMQVSQLKNQSVVDDTYQLELTRNHISSTAYSLFSGTATKPTYTCDSLKEATSSILGQDEVVDTAIDKLMRSQLNLSPHTRPTSWLFAGPSGTGKTELAKILSHVVVGTSPIIVEMSEYAHTSDINKIIGSPDGYVGSNSHREKPFDSLESNPYQFIIVNEFEKAHPAVQRLFLGVLDQGYMTMSKGNNLDFSHATIIATCNAGSDVLQRGTLGFSESTAVDTTRLMTELHKHFDKETVGRFDWVTSFAPIDKETYGDIIRDKYIKQYNYIAETNPQYLDYIAENISNDDVARLTRTYYRVEHGARSADKAVTSFVEDIIIRAMF